jgi:hypothetical protein
MRQHKQAQNPSPHPRTAFAVLCLLLPTALRVIPRQQRGQNAFFADTPAYKMSHNTHTEQPMIQTIPGKTLK